MGWIGGLCRAMAGGGGVGEAPGRGRSGGGVWELVVKSLEMRLLSVLFCCEASASEHRAPAWSKCVLAAKDEDESS